MLAEQPVLQGHACALKDVLGPSGLLLVHSEVDIASVNQARPDLDPMLLQQSLDLRARPRAIERNVESPRVGTKGIAIHYALHHCDAGADPIQATERF
jgi:hypothetical protein